MYKKYNTNWKSWIYIYQIIAVRDSVPITFFTNQIFMLGQHINIYKCIIIIMIIIIIIIIVIIIIITEHV